MHDWREPELAAEHIAMRALVVLGLAVALAGCATVAPKPAEWELVDGAWVQEPKAESAPVTFWNAKECRDLTGSLERWGCVALEVTDKAYREILPGLDALQHMPK